ncbi:MAG: exo-alpha-sialidase [Clostridia bacterium]|nr:exo-alpha-sialidase [Clostridia bacterium]
MKLDLVCNLPPVDGNPRNSEGTFARGFKGEILYAYSRYTGESCHDDATCDIALIRSFDEGNTWSEPVIIARAKEDFGTNNVMSVSSVVQKNGDLAFYFLIKELDYTTSIGRVLTRDGENFTAERCQFDKSVRPGYFCVNNDRIVRLSDGRLMAPWCWVCAEAAKIDRRDPCHCGAFLSDDDGKTFYDAGFDFVSTDLANTRYGFQEPGMIELSDRLYYWTRTGYGRQYETVSFTGPSGFHYPQPSIFTSPVSPMQIKKHNGILYNAYNPKPRWNGYEEYEQEHPGVWSRSPMVLRISRDEGKTWGKMNVVGDDPDRGYSYPAMFFTEDGHLLLGICRGSGAEGNNLCTIGIYKIDLSTVEE